MEQSLNWMMCEKMNPNPRNSESLASLITQKASKQTYYTIRFLVDRERVADAFRAYGYFRWVDDVIDSGIASRSGKNAFVTRQQSLIEACYKGEIFGDLCDEEWILVDLIRNDTEKNSGLQVYLRNMMSVMFYDARRIGQTINQVELAEYSRLLATAVTEALFYFIGHNTPEPYCKERYLSVTAAHITHMLRDTCDDIEMGYFNVSSEHLNENDIKPDEVTNQAYREWVQKRVHLAREYFREGRKYNAQIKNLRARLAGYAYMARFEWVLNLMERDNYYLRPDYPERKSLRAGLWMVGYFLSCMFVSTKKRFRNQNLSVATLFRTEDK